MNRSFLAGAFSALAVCLVPFCHATEPTRAELERATSAVVHPVMEKHRIPGLSVGLVVEERTYIFNYGMATVEGRHPVTDDTIFEIGSISKAFTATLAALAETKGKLRLSGTVAAYLPELADTNFGSLELYHLATHTTGGLPLQVPDEIRNDNQLLDYLRAWTPSHETGTVRTYANPGIGMLGMIAAKSLGRDFGSALDQEILQPLGLEHTYLDVPASKQSSYAYGYTKDHAPVRVNPGMLADQAYGIKTTARDLARFIQANMNLLQPGGTLRTALDNTRKGYFRVGDMMQDLIWEQYALPVDLQALTNGNSAAVIYNAIPVLAQTPPAAPNPDAWINKTGSTNGFGAYVAFVPSRRFGIVLLANKNYPNEDRVEIAFRIFEALSRREEPSPR